MKKLAIGFCCVFIVFLFFNVDAMHAQANLPPPPDGGGGPGSVNDVPIDGFLVYALVLGVCIGIWGMKSLNSKQID